MNKKYTLDFWLSAIFMMLSSWCVGQNVVEVTYTAGFWDSENGWELIDVTTGTQVLCAATGGGAAGGTFPFTVVNGNTYELRTYEDFCCGWDGAQIEFVDVTAGVTLFAQGDPGSSANGGNPCDGTPGTGDVIFSGQIPALCSSPTVGNPTISFANCPSSLTINFDVTDMGDATSLTVTNDAGGTNPAPITAIGTYSVTMLPTTGTVSISLAHDVSTDCDVDLGPYILECPPINNDCGNAIELVGVASGSTSASTNVEGLTACSGGGGGGTCAAGGTGTTDFSEGVWFYYTSTVAGSITVSTSNAGTNFDTEIQVFEGSCGSLTCVGGDDDAGGPDGIGDPFDSEFCWLSTASVAPVTYYIYIDGHGGATGDFVLTIADVPLPVELISFEAQAMEKENKLTWETASEENTEWHIIERSSDGQSTWTEIGRTQAAGTSAQIQQYELMDSNPLANAYYRIKSLDFDLRYEYSNVVNVKRENAPGDISVYPNPVEDQLNVDFTLDRLEEVSISLTDVTGKVVSFETFTAQRGENRHFVDFNNLQTGVYFISMTSSTGTVTERVVKN